MSVEWLTASTKMRTNISLQKKTVSLCKNSAQIVTKFSKTIILLCRRILVQLQCSFTANELHMRGKGINQLWRLLSQSLNVLNVL